MGVDRRSEAANGGRATQACAFASLLGSVRPSLGLGLLPPRKVEVEVDCRKEQNSQDNKRKTGQAPEPD